MLAGMLAVHNSLIESEKEKLLRKENNALEKSERIISRKLQEIDAVFASLEEKDRELHKKFFGSDERSEPVASAISNQRLLLADPSSAKYFMKRVEAYADEMLGRAGESSIDARNYQLLFEKRVFLASLPTGMPVTDLQPQQIFSGFGMRVNPFHKGLYHHGGVDISVLRGTVVRSTAAGIVTTVKRSALQAGYGNYVEIDHGNGFVSRYAHLDEVSVREGQSVKKGITVGTAGSSGGAVAPHLHYEILCNGKNTDPLKLMIDGLSARDHRSFLESGRRQNQALD